MESLSFLLYRSETDILARSAPARQILGEARSRNADLNLTGFLHHEEGFFFQWLEGPVKAVKLVSGLIERDARHRKMTTLWDGALDDRQFAKWRMAYSTEDDDSILAWLAKNPVAQREKLPYAMSILNFLRFRDGNL